MSVRITDVGAEVLSVPPIPPFCGVAVRCCPHLSNPQQIPKIRGPKFSEVWELPARWDADMSSCRVIATAGDWAVASDGIQWILMRRKTRNAGAYWHPVSFVRSTRATLARVMREKGTDERSAARLLYGLPDSFEQFKTLQPTLEHVDVG
jgi:hypothetical protein